MSIDVNRSTVTPIATIADFAAYVAQVGVEYRDITITGSLDLGGGSYTLPANINLRHINAGQKISNGTITINSMTADPLHKCFNSDLTIRGLRRVRPEWFGALGDGVNDDTAGIQAALIALVERSDDDTPPIGSNDPGAWGQYGGEYIFQAKNYRITSTIYYAGGIKGVHFHSSGMGSRGGLGSNVSANGWDSRIFWDPAVEDRDPTSSIMFYFQGCSRIKFSGIDFWGAPGSNNSWTYPTPVHGENAWDDQYEHVHTCVLFDDNHADIFFDKCGFLYCAIGLRICSQFDYETNLWDDGVQAYRGGTWYGGRRVYNNPTNIVNPAVAAVGGHQSDNHSLTNCGFAHCNYAGVSIESSQALDMYFEKPYFVNCGTDYYITACQGVYIVSPTFLNSYISCLVFDQKASSGGLQMLNFHEESTRHAAVDVWGSFTGPGFKFVGGNLNNVRLRAAGFGSVFTFEGVSLGILEVKSSMVSLDIKNSYIFRYSKENSVISGKARFDNVDISHMNCGLANYLVTEVKNSRMGQMTELSKLPQYYRVSDEDSKQASPHIVLGDASAYTPVIRFGTLVAGNVVDVNNIMFVAGSSNDLTTLAVGTVGGRRATFDSTGTAEETADNFALCVNTLNPSSPGLVDGTWPSAVNWAGIEIDPGITITATVEANFDVALTGGIALQVSPQPANQNNFKLLNSLSSQELDRYPVIDLRGVIITVPAITISINGDEYTAGAVEDFATRTFLAYAVTSNDYITADSLAKCINDATYGTSGVTATNPTPSRSVLLESATAITLVTSNQQSVLFRTTDTVGMEGTALFGNSTKYIACTGCYQDAYGRLLATATSGVIYEQTTTGIKISRFSGALVGELILGDYASATVAVIYNTVSDNFDIVQAGKGIKMKSPDGTQFTVTVSNAGALVVT